MTYQHQRKDMEGHSTTIYFRMCVVFVFFLMQACSAVSQPKIDLIPYRIDSLWGFSDPQGNIVIPTQYEGVSFFDAGYAQVYKNDKWGIIDTLGNIVIPIQFDLKYFWMPTERVRFPIPVEEGGLYGYINIEGEHVIDPKFEAAGTFKGDYAVTKDKGKYGLINRLGEFIVEPMYDRMHFNGQYLSVELDDRNGIVDTLNNVVVPIQFNTVIGYGDGFIVTSRDSNRNVWYGAYYKGRSILPVIYRRVEIASVNPLLFTFSHDLEDWGLIDSAGTIVLEPKFKGGIMSTSGIHFRNGEASLFSVDSSVVKEMEEKEMKGDTTGLKEYMESIGVYEYINTDLETTFRVKCKLCFLLPFSGETYPVMGWFTDGEDVRLYNKNGERIENYIGRMVDNRSMIVDLEKGKVGFVNEKGKKVIPMKYSIPMPMEELDDELRHNVLNFSDFSSTTGLAKVYVDRKRYGFIGTDGFEYFQFTDK